MAAADNPGSGDERVVGLIPVARPPSDGKRGESDAASGVDDGAARPGPVELPRQQQRGAAEVAPDSPRHPRSSLRTVVRVLVLLLCSCGPAVGLLVTVLTVTHSAGYALLGFAAGFAGSTVLVGLLIATSIRRSRRRGLAAVRRATGHGGSRHTR